MVDLKKFTDYPKFFPYQLEILLNLEQENSVALKEKRLSSTKNKFMHVKEIDSRKSKESKGSISLKSFLLSFFDFQSRLARKGVTDLIKPLLRLKKFTVRRSYSAISSFTSFACMLSLPLTNHNGTMGKRSLEEGEEQQQQKKNKNNKKQNPLICLSVSLRDEMGFSRRRVSCASSAALKSPLSSYHQREFLMLLGTLQWMKFMHVKEIDSWKSKESKGSISLKSFLLSFFDFQSRPGRKGVTDLINLRLKNFTVRRSYSAISSFTSFACMLSLPLTNHNGFG
ncbi:hypothetical protein F8388_021808 [Cannabis sativa]|uniref:Uncharacterized protein n=1 Tax=Cannabis sativa TaxID=3483 RepID=A0A7J6E4P4_CANSA|nr:hypothetical protein F8388_021808 [Cannabis sativa]KAF4384055.1 hypothetical protein G4B88_030951 [Cannabis sativa]